jgi:hypothetical protein
MLKREIILSKFCNFSLSLSCIGLPYVLFSNRITLSAYYLLYTDLCIRLGVLLSYLRILLHSYPRWFLLLLRRCQYCSCSSSSVCVCVCVCVCVRARALVDCIFKK